ncbi:hypothetical protein HDU67_007064 [Dinochytrium kinnereticum]|nr:hypothetical protein HDU67_007064 [Dinochytrium kinnereticum]
MWLLNAAEEWLEKARLLLVKLTESEGGNVKLAITAAAVILGAGAVLAVSKSGKKTARPPVVPSYPIIGNPAFFSKRYQFLKECRERYGNFFEFRLGGYRVFHVAGVPLRQVRWLHATDTTKLSMSEGYKALHGSIPDVRSIMAKTEEGAGPEMKMSLFQRRIGMLLRNERMNDNLPQLIKDMRDCMLKWGTEGEMDPFRNFFKLVFQLTVRMLGPTEIASSEELQTKLENLYLTIEYSAGVVSNFLPWIPSKKRDQRDIANKDLFIFLSGILDDRINERASGVFREKKDAVDSLLDAGDSKYDIISFVVGSLFAGYLNTGMASAWLVVFLLNQPDWTARILAELETACVHHAAAVNKPAYIQPGVPDLSVLPLSAFEKEMPSLNACISETLRMITSGGTMLRRVVKPGIIVEGFELPPGSILSYASADTHLNENYYKDPETFDPSRFENKNDEPLLSSKDMYEFLGWGAGRHPCLGMNFAKIELKIIVCLALTQYSFKLMSTDKTPQINRNDFIRAVPLHPVKLKFMTRVTSA